MEFLRRLFGGLMRGGAPAERFVPYYIRPKRCPEVVVVRVDLYNDLSQDDDGGYFVRKTARGERCPFAAEVHITFNKSRQPIEVSVENGEHVSADDYQAWLDSKGTA